MRRAISRLSPRRGFAIGACAVLLMAMNGHALPALKAQSAPTAAAVPDLAGIWDGTRRSHPTNSATIPWARTVPEGAILPDGTHSRQELRLELSGAERESPGLPEDFR